MQNVKCKMQNMVRSFLILLLILTLMGFSFLDPVARKNEEGNRLFEKGEYEEALKRYQEAQVEDPESPYLHFNAGDAFYKMGDFEAAMQEFGRALNGKDASLQAGTYYNLGNTFFRQQKLQEAAEAYKKSLELRPDDLDAKINLELVQEMLEQQQQQQQQQQQGEDDQSEEDREQSEKEQSSRNDEQQQDQQDQKQQEQQDKQGEEQKQEAQKQEGEQQEDRPADQEPAQEAAPREGELTQEEAQRLLDALKDREAEAQKRRQVRITGRRYTGNEW